ncbi:MAG TPA: LysM peptidoglycan-binding domain-containing protein [Thermoanaerobaculia bacterium]|nr:LysM peptidoglycan-binding domain-containing protein [Thermoanaerobaculia bacterium]
MARPARLTIALILLLTTAPVAAQEDRPCGEAHRVLSGETLSGIAGRCGLSLGEILGLNPQIENPDRILQGQEIRLQPSPSDQPPAAEPDTQAASETDAEETPSQPQVSIFPVSGPAGTDVTLVAEDLPPNQEVRLAGGPRTGAYTEIATAITSSEGQIERDLRVPANAPTDDDFVFYVITEDPLEEFASNEFFVMPAPGEVPEEEVRGDYQPVTIEVTGRITREASGCTTMRNSIGVLYALVGNVPAGMKEGEEVLARGRLAWTSPCTRGIVIDVRELERRQKEPEEREPPGNL